MVVMKNRIKNACSLAVSRLIKQFFLQPSIAQIRAVLVCGTMMVFVGDLALPLGVAAGAPYAIVIYGTSWSKYQGDTIVLTVLASLLIIVGYYTSPGSHIANWTVEANRLLSLLMVLLCAILVVQRRFVDEVNTRLKVMVHTDSMTGAGNRLAFDLAVQQEILRTERYQRPFSLIIFDIDNFKSVNDCYGHDIGDVVIRRVCSEAQSVLRSSDALFRVGGEEFSVLSLEADLSKAELVAEKIRVAVAGCTIKEIAAPVTVSLGVAEFDKNDGKDTLIKRADQAMYNSKNSGKNRVTAAGVLADRIRVCC